jgi:Arc/MetJ-type ribon-helix-helix transcriptional regulator
MATTTKRQKLINILFQVPPTLKKMIEIRMFNEGFVSQSEYLKYLIRRDLEEEQKELERHDQLINEIVEMSKDVDTSKIPSLEDQFADFEL